MTDAQQPQSPEPIITSDATAVAAAKCLGWRPQMTNEPDSTGRVFFRIGRDKGPDGKIVAASAEQHDKLRRQIRDRDLEVNVWSFLTERHKVVDQVKAITRETEGANNGR